MRFDPFVHERFYDDFRASPLVVYDVGAAGQLFSFFPPGADSRGRIIAFEPTPESYQALVERYGTDANVEALPLALSDIAGPTDLHFFGSAPTSSGVGREYLVDADGIRDYSVVSVNADTLDAIALEGERHPPSFLKLDVEGGEAAVLRGGRSTLAGHVLGVLVEVKLLPYHGSSLAEIHGLLSEHGLLLFDLQTGRQNRSGRHGIGGKKGPLASLQLLYLRDLYALQGGTSSTMESRRSQLLHMLAILNHYLYLDYAIELVLYGREQDLLTGGEADLLANMYTTTQDASWRIPDFPGKRLLATLADLISYLLQPTAKIAVPPLHNNLGNRPRLLTRSPRPDAVVLSYPIRSWTDPESLVLRISTGGVPHRR